jgi:hypothetical protein
VTNNATTDAVETTYGASGLLSADRLKSARRESVEAKSQAGKHFGARGRGVPKAERVTDHEGACKKSQAGESGPFIGLQVCG